MSMQESLRQAAAIDTRDRLAEQLRELRKTGYDIRGDEYLTEERNIARALRREYGSNYQYY